MNCNALKTIWLLLWKNQYFVGSVALMIPSMVSAIWMIALYTVHASKYGCVAATWSQFLAPFMAHFGVCLGSLALQYMNYRINDSAKSQACMKAADLDLLNAWVNYGYVSTISVSLMFLFMIGNFIQQQKRCKRNKDKDRRKIGKKTIEADC